MGGYPCCCNVDTCLDTTLSESFAGSIPSDWYLSNTSGSLTTSGGKLTKTVTGTGSGFTLGPCLKQNIFGSPFTIGLETQISRDGFASANYRSGVRFSLSPFYAEVCRRENTPGGVQVVELIYNLGSGEVVAYTSTESFANGDVIRLEVDGDADAVEELRCYYNGVLDHTETFGTPEDLSGIGVAVAYGWLNLNTNSGLSFIEEYEYFDIDIT